MSNMENNPIAESIYALGRKVSELLKLGDTGKVDSFITRVKGQIEREINVLERNLDTTKFEYKQELLGLKDAVEDEQTALEDAYASINPKQIKTNAEQKAYAEHYLQAISRAKYNVKMAKDKINSAEESHKEVIKDAKEQINDLKDTLENISKPA